MGVERVVEHAGDVVPSWPAILAELQLRGESPALRMIDGMLALPDEQPEDGWRELRLGFAGGMLTLRRSPGQLACVMWGNAGPELQASAEKLCEAAATATGGTLR